jgi:hypothetical protein
MKLAAKEFPTEGPNTAQEFEQKQTREGYANIGENSLCFLPGLARIVDRWTGGKRAEVLAGIEGDEEIGEDTGNIEGNQR